MNAPFLDETLINGERVAHYAMLAEPDLTPDPELDLKRTRTRFALEIDGNNGTYREFCPATKKEVGSGVLWDPATRLEGPAGLMAAE